MGCASSKEAQAEVKAEAKGKLQESSSKKGGSKRSGTAKAAVDSAPEKGSTFEKNQPKAGTSPGAASSIKSTPAGPARAGDGSKHSLAPGEKKASEAAVPTAAVSGIAGSQLGVGGRDTQAQDGRLEPKLGDAGPTGEKAAGDGAAPRLDPGAAKEHGAQAASATAQRIQDGTQVATEGASQQAQAAGPHERVMFLSQVQPPSPPMGPSVVEVPEAGVWLRFSYLTQRGYYPEAPGKANQDSFCVVPQFGGVASDHLFGVFDGHGEHGTPCSQFSRDKLAENMLRHPKLDTDLVAAFNEAFQVTNQQLHQSNIDDTMSGSTGIAVYMRNRTLVAANVGDSRAVLAQWSGTGEDGKGEERLVAVDLSNDQTPFRQDECERVKACGARVLTLDQLEGLKDPNVQCWGGEEDDDGDPPRLWVQNGMYPGTAFTRSLGDSVAEKIGVNAVPEMMEIEVDPQKHPFFVVASDGVFEFLSSQDVVDMVAQHNDPHAACAQVVAQSYRLWLQYETRTDDITIIIVHIDDQLQVSRAELEASQTLYSSAASQASNRAFSALALQQRSMLSDLAVFHRRAIEGSEPDFQPSADLDLDGLPDKSSADKERLLMAIRNNFLFHMLPDDELALVLRAFETREVKPGDVIIQQGEEGDRFFVCDSGEFDVLVETGQDEDELGTLVHRYVADAGHAPSFGDLALMYGTRREASVRAATAGRIWSLQRSLFRAVQTRPVVLDQLGPTPSPSCARFVRALRTLPFLAPLSFGQLQRLAYFMKLIQLADGQTMALDPECFYVFFDGEVETLSDDPGAAEGKGSAGGGGLQMPANGEVKAGQGAGNEQGIPAGMVLSFRRGKHPHHSYPEQSDAGQGPAQGPGSGDGPGGRALQHRPGARFMPQWVGEEVLLGSSGANGASAKSEGRRVKAVGQVAARYITRAEFEGAVGSLLEQTDLDNRIQGFRTELHTQLQQSGRQKALDDIANAEVEWLDTLSSNEWSELGNVGIRSLGETLGMKRFGKKRVKHAKREAHVLREKVLLHTLAASPFVPPVIKPYVDAKDVGVLLDCQLATPLALLLADPLPEECVQFVAASLVVALQLLHKDGVVFRGVAPPTIFLDSQAMLQLPDLRFSKRLSDGRTFTLCGYPDFVAPEMIAGMGHGQPADWWALGVLIYTMLQGEGPFGSWKDSELQVYTRIARRSMEYPDHFSAEVVSLIDQLLAFNPEDRLGCGPGGAEAVKQHPWFQGVPWQAIANRQCEAPEALRQRVADVVDQRLRTLEEQRELLQQQQSYLDQMDDADAQGAPEPGANGASGSQSPWFEGW